MILHTRTSLGFLTSSRGTIRLLHREPGHCVRHAPRLDPRAGHGGAAPERAAPRPEQGSLGKLDGTWDHEELYGEDEEARDDRICCEGEFKSRSEKFYAKGMFCLRSSQEVRLYCFRKGGYWDGEETRR